MTKTILIVDDEVSIREILSFLFKDRKWDVLVAAEGFEALELYDQHRPEVVLTDINMPQKSNGEPGLGGMDLIKRLKSTYGEKLPFIYVMSGFLDNREKVEKLEVVSTYFEKPNISTVVQQICKTFDQLEK